MKFAKLQALGNDFLVVDMFDVPAEVDLGQLAERMCDRHFGAGADGLVVYRRSFAPTAAGSGWRTVPGVGWSSRIFNADGGEAEVSGNGTRCLAAWLDASGLWTEEETDLRVSTLAGVKAVRRADDGGKGDGSDGGKGGRDEGGLHETGRLYETDMGEPAFESAAVPMRLDPPRGRVADFALDVGGVRVDVTALSVGNPHCTLFVDDVDAIDFASLGPQLERHELFPSRVNVEFVQVVAPDRLRARFWERGAGPTLSSGTGASAATVAGALTGRCTRSVTVETPAGPLRVSWSEENNRVRLTGGARLVYTGDWASGAR